MLHCRPPRKSGEAEAEAVESNDSVEDIRQVLADFNDTAVEYADRDQMLHGLFEAQARDAPEKTAVIFEGREYSYGEINSEANRLAHHLRGELHIRPDDPVGILVDRSARMVVAILAILKAGGAYVPIDPKYPGDMIRYMLEDAQVKALLLDSEHVRLADGLSGILFFLDIEMQELTTPGTDPDPVNAPSDLAYIIYTSGSTGQRKGVAIEHRLIMNTLLWRRQAYGFDQHDVAIQIPSYAFDSSVLDLFSMFMAGARLVILKDGYKTDVDYLRRLVLQYSATHMLVTPTFYKMLLEGLHDIDSLKKITLAGEAATQALVAKHFCYLPKTRLINEYGPTENAVCSTATDLSADDNYVSIGRPISNVKAYILDESQQSVPLGVVGELCLAGHGVARGYLNRPDLTEEKFIPDPFSTEPGARLYRTGDLARWRADGRLEYLGRLDDQVKLRGQRVEPGEIEHALAEHPSIEDVAVVCMPDAEGEQQLIGYVVQREPMSPDQLREHLLTRVPSYMVPAGFVAIDALPLTANGKVDREALPDPEHGRMDAPTTHLAPRTPVEETLVGIWQRLLKRNRLSVIDDFFELGGNSLQAAQLLLEIRNTFQVELTLPDMFNNQTIARLAAKVEAARPSALRRDPAASLRRDNAL